MARTRPVSRVLLSLLMPGLGHFAVGAPGRGCAWLAASLLAFPTVRLAPALGVLAVLALRVAPAIAVGWTREGPRIPTPTRVFLVFLAVLAGTASYGLVLRTFVVEAFKIPGGSMIPTLEGGAHIFADKAFL